MKAGDIPKDVFPIILESDDPNEPPLIWAGHVSIAIVTSEKEEDKDSVRDGAEAAPTAER